MPNTKTLFCRTKGHIAEMLAKEHTRHAYRPRELPVDLLEKFKIRAPPRNNGKKTETQTHQQLSRHQSR